MMKPFILLIILIILLFLLFILSLRVISISSVELNLEKISCADEKKLQKEINLKGKNFFSVEEKNIEESLKEKFFCIDNIAMEKSFPNKVKVSVFGVQPNAFVLATGSAIPVGSERAAQKIYNKLISLNLEIKKVSTLAKNDLLVEGTYKIYFSLEKNIDFQLASLQLILNKAKIESDKVEYIDLRFERPVIK